VFEAGEGYVFRMKKRANRNGRSRGGGKREQPFDPASPFAKLRELTSVR